MKKFLFCMIGTMMSLLCCGTKAPEGQLVLLEYTKSGTMAGYEYFGRVEKLPNGTFVVIAMKESYGDLYQKKIGKEELEKLKQIIVEEKMMKYKEHYRPVFALCSRCWTVICGISRLRFRKGRGCIPVVVMRAPVATALKECANI